MSTFPANTRAKLVKCLALIASDKDNEALIAARTANKIAASAGGWERILMPPIPEGANHIFDWRLACHQVIESRRASPWELQFCSSLLGRWRGAVLTQKQAETLQRIHADRCERRSA